MTYRGRVKNGQIMLEEPVRLPEGAQVDVQVIEQQGRLTHHPDRREILRLPVERRRELLTEQSGRLAAHYESDSGRIEWQGGDIVE